MRGRHGGKPRAVGSVARLPLSSQLLPLGSVPALPAHMRRIVLTVLLLSAACSDEPEAALEVGAAAFAPSQIQGLSPEQLVLLADVAAFASLVADDALDTIIAPLARHEAHLARLRVLPYELAARDLPADSLRAVYARDPDLELTVRHVVRLVPRWADDDARAEARAAAAAAERRARAGEDFAALAGELSEEPGAARRGGLLEPGREGSWVDPFWEAAVALEPGEVSPVIETEYGYHVLKLDARRVLPFEDADRLPVLRRAVSPTQARLAMEAWVASQPPVTLDPPAVSAARAALEAGDAPDSIVISRSEEGDVFHSGRLALSWASLEPDRRAELLRADDASFGMWVQDEARQALWSDAAERLGVEPPAAAAAEATGRWRARLAAHAAALGLTPGLPGDRLTAASLAALAVRGQDALIARAELPALRPLLRGIYPVTVASDTISEMRSSGSRR